MSAFTPGPWTEIPQNGAGPMICRKFETGKQMNPVGLRLVCHVLARGSSIVEDEANARLIAAAPDLLEAARAAYTRLADIRNDWYGRHTSEGQRLLCMLRDAISKATGMDAEDVQDAASVPQATGAQS